MDNKIIPIGKNDLVNLFLSEKEKYANTDMELFYNGNDGSIKYTRPDGQGLKVSLYDEIDANTGFVNHKEDMRYYPTITTKKRDSIPVQHLEYNGKEGIIEEGFSRLPEDLIEIAQRYQFDRDSLALPDERKEYIDDIPAPKMKKNEIERD